MHVVCISVRGFKKTIVMYQIDRVDEERSRVADSKIHLFARRAKRRKRCTGERKRKKREEEEEAVEAGRFPRNLPFLPFRTVKV